MDTQGSQTADNQTNREVEIEHGAYAPEPDITDQPTTILGPESAPAPTSAQPAPPAEPVASPTGPAEATAIEPQSPIPEAVPSAGATPALATPIVTEPEPSAASPVTSMSQARAQEQPRVVPVATPRPGSPTEAPVAPPAVPSPREATGPLAAVRTPRVRGRFAPIAAALVVLGAAGAGTTYLILSRRRRVRSARPLDLAAARTRLARVWVTTSATTRAALSRLPSLDGSLAVERLRRGRPGFSAGAYFRAMRDTVSRRAADIDATVRAAAMLLALPGVRQAVWQRIRAMGTLMSGVGDAARVGMDRATTYGMRIGVAGKAILALPRRISHAARLAFASQIGRARVVASSRVEATRRATARRTARMGRRLRWFRRGLYAGAVWGMLFAPDSGQATREKLSAAFRGLQRGEVATPTVPSPAVHAGSAGPHPLSPAETARAPFTGVESSVPFLQPTSEEPLAPPPPDLVEGELPGTPSVS